MKTMFDKMNKCFDKSNEKWDKLINSWKQMSNEIREQTEKCQRDTDKLNENEESKFNQVMENKVSEGVSESNRIEVVVSENKTLNNDYNNDSVVAAGNGSCLLYTSRCV